MTNAQLDRIYWPLRVTYGLVPLLAGLDKFLNLLTRWDLYLAPPIAHILPVDAATFMHIVGIIEIAVGIVILTRWTRPAAYVAAAWLVAIAFNLVIGHFFDIAVRDLAMAVGAWSLAQLSEIREVEYRPARTAPTPSPLRA